MGMFNIYDEMAKTQASPQATGMAYAKLPRGRGSVALAGQAGQMMSQGAMGAMGMKTPAEERQEKINQVRQQFPNPQSDTDFRTLGNALNSIGENDMAEKAFDQIKDKTDTTRGRDIQKHAEILGCDWNDPTPDNEGLTCKQKSLAAYKETVRAGASERGEGKFAEKAMEDLVEKNSLLITNAESAVATIEKTNRVLDLLDKGELHTGMFAEFKNNISRVLAMAGSDVSSGYASRTQLLEALLGSDVFPMIKQLGIGARGLDTPAEREFLLKVMTGEKSMDAKAIRELTEIRQRISEKIIEKYNKKVTSGGFDKYMKYTDEDVSVISLEGFKKKKVPTGSIATVGPDGKKYMFDPKTGKMYFDGREVNIPQ